jgi:hypothetical protein
MVGYRVSFTLFLLYLGIGLLKDIVLSEQFWSVV